MRIVEFLLARIGEDEAVARAATGKRWHGQACEVRTVPGEDPRWFRIAEMYHANHFQDAKHIARHDPARVLAECAAKRAIIAAATSWEHEFNPSAYYACRAYKLKEDTWKVLKISEGKCNCGVTQQRNAILKPLAAVYAGHADYQQKWD